jgi:hypothetical protein
MSHEMRMVTTSGEQSSAAERARLPVPTPRAAIAIRPAVAGDLAFIDGLQKKHNRMVGWMPTGTLEGKIRAGHVLIAESAECSVLSAECSVLSAESSVQSAECSVLSAESHSSSLSTQNSAPSTPVGYCIGNDQYFKRDDVGIIYQMNVVPGRQRALVGATLLKAQFERSAWGCKLYCCWCAQDIEANRFWEAMGFVPLAFRTGSRTRGKDGTPRMHIFWQKRIRSGDETTPYWFPSQTGSGAIREDRLVLPIPPGTSWRDAKPIVLPGSENQLRGENQLLAENQLLVASGELLVKKTRAKRSAQATSNKQPATNSAIASGGLRFGPAPQAAVVPVEKAKREPRKKEKNDPRLVAAARELRDRWLEHANAHPEALVANGKYDVTRQIADMRMSTVEIAGATPALPVPQLAAA